MALDGYFITDVFEHSVKRKGWGLHTKYKKGNEDDMILEDLQFLCRKR